MILCTAHKPAKIFLHKISVEKTIFMTFAKLEMSKSGQKILHIWTYHYNVIEFNEIFLYARYFKENVCPLSSLK